MMMTLSGYKTWIGLVVVGVGAILDVLGVSGSETVKEWGLILTGVGGAHKIVKERTAVKR